MISVRLDDGVPLRLVASPDYLAAFGAPETPRDVLGHRCLSYRLPTAGSLYPWTFERAGETLSLEPPQMEARLGVRLLNRTTRSVKPTEAGERLLARLRPALRDMDEALAALSADQEHAPFALDAGLGLVPWSPLAYGLLSGKYDRAAVEAGPARAGGLPDEAASGQDTRSARLDGANPFGDSLFTDRN